MIDETNRLLNKLEERQTIVRILVNNTWLEGLITQISPRGLTITLFEEISKTYHVILTCNIMAVSFGQEKNK